MIGIMTRGVADNRISLGEYDLATAQAMRQC